MATINLQILNKLKNKLLDDEEIIEVKNIQCIGKRGKKSRVYLIINTNRRKLFVKYVSNGKHDVFKKEAEALKKVSSGLFFAPQFVGLLDRGMITSEIEGNILEKIIRKSGPQKSLKLLKKAVSLIASFHKKHQCVINKSDKCKKYKLITGHKIPAEIKNVMDQVSFGFTHGDLDPFNMIYNVKKNKFGIIDWEDFRGDGIQGLDAIHFIIMLGVIANSSVSHRSLYQIIFRKNKKNVYFDLLKKYCDESSVSVDTILRLIPVYCDSQNLRLRKAGRSPKNFLYTEFRKMYYEFQ